MAGKSKKTMNPYIAELHRENGIATATEAARQIGISPMTYHRYAYDDINCEYMETLLRIARGLGVSADEFMRRYIKSKSSSEDLRDRMQSDKITEQLGRSSS